MEATDPERERGVEKSEEKRGEECLESSAHDAQVRRPDSGEGALADQEELEEEEEEAEQEEEEEEEEQEETEQRTNTADKREKSRSNSAVTPASKAERAEQQQLEVPAENAEAGGSSGAHEITQSEHEFRYEDMPEKPRFESTPPSRTADHMLARSSSLRDSKTGEAKDSEAGKAAASGTSPLSTPPHSQSRGFRSE